MPFTYYTSTIVASKHALASLTHILSVAEKQTNASDLPSARLAPDMRPLTSQIHLAAQTIERILARLALQDHEPIEDTISSFAEMHARIAATQALLDATDEATVNSRGDEVAPTMLLPGWKVPMTAAGYSEGAMANLYFHLSIAYAILRKEGVPLGKQDFIMPFVGDYLEGVDVAGVLAGRAEGKK